MRAIKTIVAAAVIVFALSTVAMAGSMQTTHHAETHHRETRYDAHESSGAGTHHAADARLDSTNGGPCPSPSAGVTYERPFICSEEDGMP